MVGPLEGMCYFVYQKSQHKDSDSIFFFLPNEMDPNHYSLGILKTLNANDNISLQENLET